MRKERCRIGVLDQPPRFGLPDIVVVHRPVVRKRRPIAIFVPKPPPGPCTPRESAASNLRIDQRRLERGVAEPFVEGTGPGRAPGRSSPQRDGGSR